MIEFPLDAREVVVVVVNTLRGGEIFSFDVDCGVSDTVAFGPLLVAFNAGEGAGSRRAAGTAVYVWFCMTRQYIF